MWGGTGPTTLSPVVMLQKRIVRIIAGEHFLSHTGPIFRRLEILKVGDIHKYLVALYVFSHKSQFIHNCPNPYTTRESGSMVPLFQRLSLTQRSMTYYGPQTWNSLPDTVRNVSDYAKFKKLTKKYLVDLYK